ncbi:unnamed protein product, partial [Rotaria magnacalcarata]
SSLLGNDYPVDNAVHPYKNLSNVSPSDLRVSLSDSYYSAATTRMIDTEGHRVSSTVSVKRLKRADIDQLDNKGKLNETENVNNASATDADCSTNSGRPRRSTVSVVRISKANEVSLRQSITSQPEEPLSASSTKWSKSGPVKVTKILRDKSVIGRQIQAKSVHNISTIDMSKNIIKHIKVTA